MMSPIAKLSVLHSVASRSNELTLFNSACTSVLNVVDIRKSEPTSAFRHVSSLIDGRVMPIDFPDVFYIGVVPTSRFVAWPIEYAYLIPECSLISLVLVPVNTVSIIMLATPE